MATKEQLETALRNAHRAGDSNSARRLAAELKKMSAPATPNVDKVKAEFNAMPWHQQGVQALDDVLRIGSNGLTFGFRDKLAGYLGGGTPEEERAKTGDAKVRAGTAAIPAEIGPQMALMSLFPALAPAAQAAIPATAGPIPRAIAAGTGGALEGMAAAGVEAVGHDKPVLPAMGEGALWGAGGQAVSGLLSKGADALAGLFSPAAPRMSVDDLRLAKDDAYQRVDDIGAEFRPSAIDELTLGPNGIHDAVSDTWPLRHPQSRHAAERSIEELRGPAGQPRRARSLTQIDQTRQAIEKNVSRLPDAAEADYGRDMTHNIDEWLRNVQPHHVTTRSGNPEEAVDALLEARNLNSRMRKIEQLDETVLKAERQAARNLNSGEDSTMRGGLDGILSNPKRRRGFTPDELAKTDEVVRGTGTQQTLRQVGRLAPGSGAGYMGIGAGAAAGSIFGPAGAAIGATIPPAIGYVSKKLSERSTRKSVDELLELVASGGRITPKNKAIPREAQDAIARALMLMGIKEN